MLCCVWRGAIYCKHELLRATKKNGRVDVIEFTYKRFALSSSPTACIYSSGVIALKSRVPRILIPPETSLQLTHWQKYYIGLGSF